MPEILITMTIMLAVMFALYSIFDMSIRVFSLGNDKIEAVQNARLGLERMEREIRAAYPYDKSDDSTANDHLFFDTGSLGTGVIPPEDRITFGNDLSTPASRGYRRIECGNPCEYITYKLAGTPSSGGTLPACSAATAPCTLRRVNTNNSAGSGDSVVEYVRPGGLTFTYFESDGTAPENEAEIVRVQVRLEIDVDGRTQSLTSRVDLRNRTEAGP